MSGSRIFVIAGVVGLLGGTSSGCKWFHEAETERHEKNAEEAAKSGNFGEMIKEGKKADKSEKAAESAPLP